MGGTDSHLSDDIRLRKIKRAWREKKICLKKGDGLAFERWHPFEKKIKRAWREKKIFGLLLVQQNKQYYIYIYIQDQNILEKDYISKMRKMMLKRIMKFFNTDQNILEKYKIKSRKISLVNIGPENSRII